VLQLLLQNDTQAVIYMFDTLSLLQEGIYCGSDDLEGPVQALGLRELHACAPRTVLSLRQAVVNAFTALLSRDDSTLQQASSTSPLASQALTSAALSSQDDYVPSSPLAPGAPGVKASLGAPSPAFLQAMQFVGSQVLRPPPAVLPRPFAAACIAQLCTPWSPDDPAARRQLLDAFVTAVDLSDASGEGSSPAMARKQASDEQVQILVQQLLHAQLFEAAAALQRKAGDATGAMESGLQHCQALAGLQSAFVALGEAAHELVDEDVAARYHELHAQSCTLADVPASALRGSSVRSIVTQECKHLSTTLSRMFKAWLDCVEPQMQGSSAGHQSPAGRVFAQHFAFLFSLECSLQEAGMAETARCVCCTTEVTSCIVRSLRIE
jgi:hypothetical protein